MKSITRIVALLCLLAMVFTVLAACGGNGGNDTSGSGAESQAAESQEESKAELFDGLPNVKYDGDFVILVPGESHGIYASCEVVESDNYTLTLNEALENRNQLVEERFGVKIAEERVSSVDELVTLVRNETMAPTGAFDVATPYIPNAAMLAAEGSLYEFSDLKYIDLTKPCWDQNGVKSLSICGKTYFATGDMNLIAFACTHALVFNKDLVKQFGLESPYTVVEEKRWTIDKLREMAGSITADIDGEPGMSCKDRYGFLVNQNYVTSMFIGAGQQLVAKDNEDVPYISLLQNTTTAATIFSKIYDLVNDPTITGKIDATSDSYYSSAVANGLSCWDAATQSIANKLALFRSMAIIDVIDLGEYDCNFGILPTPMLDPSQDNYRSFVSTIYATAFCVPSSHPDPDKASTIVQALCEASTDTTKHAYYDIILKGRKIQDDESEGMLDIIFNNRVYDLGVIYGWGGTSQYDTNSIGNFMNTIAFSGGQSMTFASTLESISGKIQSDLEEDIAYFRK